MLPIKNILCPTDYSEASRVSLERACELARHFGSNIHLLHVMEAYETPYPYLGPPFNESVSWEPMIREQAAAALAKWELPKDAEGLNVQRSLLPGSPAVGIVNFAKENGIDLIVMPTHGRTGLAHVLLGSVAENVIRLSECPVLTVHVKRSK